jgi:hypothetical protein
MKKSMLIFLLSFLLSSCGGWVIQPIQGPTPFLPPTALPSIYTATPVVIGVYTATPAVVTLTAEPTIAISPTNTNAPLATDTIVPTASPTGPAITIVVLGCNTSIDILHGMGEVTNAFVTLKNVGGAELTNLKVTLFALDEGREHPDKTVELSTLPIGYQVTTKLTVDSTYKQETPIQVEVGTDQGIFPREGLASCTDIGVFAPNPDSLNTPVPN